MDYPLRTRKRANRAVACSPFRLGLFQDLQRKSLNLRGITLPPAQPHPYLRRSLSDLQVEQALLWLIQVGLLRREVDGQGITDRVRLTPLGYVLLSQWAHQGGLPRPTLKDCLLNVLSRFRHGLGL